MFGSGFQHCYRGRKFRRLNNKSQTLGVIVDDLSWQLFIAAFIFYPRARDRAIKTAEAAFFVSIYLLLRCLQNRPSQNQDHHPKFHLGQLRLAEQWRS